ncbi:MAG: hypothetical protein ABII93_03840 [Chrysiogenia bacterium]
MKKPIILLLAILLAGAAASLFPCDITMETQPAAAGAKNKIKVRLTVECFHRRCPVNIEETKLAAKDLVIEKRGQWKKTGEGIYQMDLMVSLKGKEKGAITVRRECPKTGHQEEILEIAPL